MVATPKTATPEEISNADKKINELYVKLQNGEKFEDLAKLHSDDPSSSQKGGELPPFGSGTSTRMLPVFEDAAFGLKNNGDFSAPIKTDYGYHILKRIDWNDVKPFNDMKKEIQSKVNRDERSKRTQDSYVETLKKEYGFIDLSNKHLQWFMDNFDSSSVNGKWSSERLKTSFELCNLAGRTYNQKDFSTYLEKNYRGQKGEDKKKTIDTQYANWIKSIVLDYEESKLTSKYPDYKALVQEYHDGILLYEIMTEKVWNKAIKDTMGLKAFFESNRSNYRWPFRIEGTVYECADNTHAKTVFKMLKKKNITSKEIIEKVNEESELNLRVKVNKFDPEQINYLKGRSFVNGRNKPYEFEGKYYVLFVDKNLPAGNKEFSEAKGAATSDYQTYLEKMWLSELEKKHSVKINKEILYSLGQ
jgi:peptidyl-prolyl cis-trans isomerase SurA